MVEGSGEVKVIEEIGVLRHAVGIVLGDEFELLHEFVTIHDFDLALDLTDDVLELVVEENHAIAVLCVLDGLIADRSSCVRESVPVGKFIGVMT